MQRRFILPVRQIRHGLLATSRHGPGNQTWDFTVGKYVPIRERSNREFQTNFFAIRQVAGGASRTGSLGTLQPNNCQTKPVRSTPPITEAVSVY